jgi:hypothetical protein
MVDSDEITGMNSGPGVHPGIVFIISIVACIVTYYTLIRINSIIFLFKTVPLYELPDVVYEILLFKLRNWASQKLSTGRLIKYNQPYTDLVYYDGMDKYTIRYPKIRGSYPFILAFNGEGVDVTEHVKNFAGPYGNFHGIVTTPSYLGHSTLSFRINKIGSNNESFVIVFRGDDVIKF